MPIGRSHLCKVLVASVFSAAPVVLWAYSTGAPPYSDGGPGGDARSCTACHGGTALNGGGGRVELQFPGGLTYTPGQKQRIRIVITDSRAQVYGYQVSARIASNELTVQAGVLNALSSDQEVICGDYAYPQNDRCRPAAPIQFLGHTRASPLGTIEFDWTPPAVDSGYINFYVAGNAANGSRSTTGDRIYTAQYRLTSSTTPISISPGGITNAASFDNTALAPGSLASLFGVFTGTNTTTASSSPWLTTLSGLSVKFNNVAAPLYYVSATQVNVQVPWEMASVSTAAVTVTVNGVASPPQSIPISSTAPGVFQYGQNQGIATNALSANLITAANPARPGLTYLTIYCTGLGLVTNQPATGVAASSTLLSHATLTPTVTIGGVPTNATFAGLSPGFIGLYQINVQVPAGTPVGNSVPLIVLMAGKPAATVFIAVQP